MSNLSSSTGFSEVFFGKNASNQPFINFFDPAYVRSETIVFEPKTCKVHAVLHENLHFLGQIPAELGASFQNGGDVLLSAPHYSGQDVKMTAHISVSKN
jgi:hypothetical protein